MDRFLVKIDAGFYAEHADGSAYVAKDKSRAMRFSDRRTARIIAASLVGAKVHVEPLSSSVAVRT